MPVRKLDPQHDLLPIADIAPEIWRYPDHPEWNVQPDEEVSLGESMRNYQRIWPLVRLLQAISPALRYLICGHVWEEEGRIAGFSQLSRRGSTDTWYISAVGVHPDFRRRGIARRLIETQVGFVRERGGKRLLLDVIDGNVPAIHLYKKLGFEGYQSNYQLELESTTPPLHPSLPKGCAEEVVSPFTWQPQFELMQRITPEALTRYEPVEAARYKKPLSARLLYPLMRHAEGMRVHAFYIRATDDALPIAYAKYETHDRKAGRNMVMANMDPAATFGGNGASLATYLVDRILHEVLTVNPDKAVEWNIPDWQQLLADAGLAAGFRLRARLLTMGLLL